MSLSAYTVVSTDRVDKLAQRLLGDFSRWRELVELNNLDYPYISTDPSQYPGLKVLGPGSTLYYRGSGVDVPAAASLEQAEAETYGRDLLLQSGYLSFVGGNLALVQGRRNLSDALGRRLATPLGDLPAHPTNYGHLLKNYIGAAANVVTAQFIPVEIERCLRADPRVQEVSTGVSLEGALVNNEVWVQPVSPIPD